MGRAIACALVLLCGSTAFAQRLVAQGKLLVTVRVVDSATVEMAWVPEAPKARPVQRAAATEWIVPMRASVAQSQGRPGAASVELQGCEGTARWNETSSSIALDQKERSASIKAVVKNDQNCSPIVLVTVLPDGAPPAG